MAFVVPDGDRWCLPAPLAQRGEELGDAPFLSFALGDALLWYGAAARGASAVAGGLAQLGVAPGDRVLLMLRNCAEFALA